MEATKIIDTQVSNQEFSEAMMEQLLLSVKKGLISKAQAISLFQNHLEETYGYRVSPKEFPYLTIVKGE